MFYFLNNAVILFIEDVIRDISPPGGGVGGGVVSKVVDGITTEWIHIKKKNDIIEVTAVLLNKHYISASVIFLKNK